MAGKDGLIPNTGELVSGLREEARNGYARSNDKTLSPRERQALAQEAGTKLEQARILEERSVARKTTVSQPSVANRSRPLNTDAGTKTNFQAQSEEKSILYQVTQKKKLEGK